jgi:glucose uptake protein GlcU
MTTSTAPAAIQSKDAFLRFALRLDAVLSGIIGIAGVALAPRIAELSGTTATLEYSMGAFFVAYGIALYALSRMTHVRTLGVLVAVGNVVFTVAAIAVVLAGVWPLTTVGVVLTLGGGVYTLVMADLQYLGLGRMRS